MLKQSKSIIESHIKTHTEHSAEDVAAVDTLKFFFRSDGKINPNFAENDKWPNIDGTFEFVANPDISRKPTQNFFVQIKGTSNYREINGVIKYSLNSLAFPAFISCDVTLDPGILFVVFNPQNRGSERVFWKYMSVNFLNSIDFNKGSTTIDFSAKDEIFNTDDSINAFCKKLELIVTHHSFVNRLSTTEFIKSDIDKIVNACNKQITESIESMDIFNLTRDDISQRILPRLYDLCSSTLLLNSLKTSTKMTNLQLAWEQAMLNIDTKYLATFLKGLMYIDRRIPDEGQSERLMLKYYNFLWQIRKFLQDNYKISILKNLEKFLIKPDKIDNEYQEMIANAFITADLSPHDLKGSRFYIQKKTPFFVGTERYYEITLQLAGVYASKYNRITAYTKENISTDYSIKIAYVDATINLWNIKSKIKIITNWKVSIEPSCLNNLGKILNIPVKINSQYGEYIALMNFLTKTGINLIDLIDLQELDFLSIIESIYKDAKTSYFKKILIQLRNDFSKKSERFGRNTVRYALLNLREEVFNSILPNQFNPRLSKTDLFLGTKCYPFERNPFISNLTGSKTSEGNFKKIANAVGYDRMNVVLPYLKLKNAIKKTGEMYFNANDIATEKEIINYNNQLDNWERQKGYRINLVDELISIESFENSTLFILKKLLEFSQKGNKGQKEFNQKFLKESSFFKNNVDELKKLAIRDVFVNSHLLLIYGAAGTGKTTLINYISNLMVNSKKLFLSKTHTAKQNLQRRIENPGAESEFVSIDSFTKKVSLTDYDVIFVDECSTIDNRTMMNLLNKVSMDTFLVFAGDIHQIESIDFGNWFYYAKDIIRELGTNVELLETWRTEDTNLLSLWNEVRNNDVLITEKLVIDGPFSEDIGQNIFKKDCEDEVVLCLNYDGKFGLNNINNYFQNVNDSSNAVSWQEWTYKEGDHILFNDTTRFSFLYNNLKGKIVKIEKESEHISFTVDVATILTENNCKKDGIEFVDIIGDATRIRFTVYAYDERNIDDEDLRMKSVIPFQLAYAVSIHKAQGLEYDSVKVVIPKSNSEKITHDIFYTAITRAKKKLKIFWSSETMEEVIESFSTNHLGFKSLEIIKKKLFLNFEECKFIL